MKKTALLLMVVVAFSASAFGVSAKNRSTDDVVSVSTFGGNVKIINDTDADVQIHTGSGFVEINKTSSTSVSCEAGKEIRLDERFLRSRKGNPSGKQGQKRQRSFYN